VKLLLQRHVSTGECTTGDLYLDGQLYCHTLEDVVRKVKIKGKTAIPSGLYKVTVNWSGKFQRPLPLLVDVPNFFGIRIHTGNTASSTEGCILVGKELGKNAIYKSREAFDDLFERIKVALNLNESITIEIKNVDAENGLLYGAGEQSYGEAIQCSKTD
jgi:hypothetical protein